jgi:AAA+ ATPase superfamily predicted ATPase
MPKYNPFRPNSIVTTSMFAGRWPQMQAIEQALFQTKNENPRNFIVLGERGIGKSSLLFAVDLNAKGNLEVTDGTKFNFLILQSELVSATSFDDLVTILATEFGAAIARRQTVRTFASNAWEFVSNWKVLGVEYKKDGGKTSEIFLNSDAREGWRQRAVKAGHLDE